MKSRLVAALALSSLAVGLIGCQSDPEPPPVPFAEPLAPAAPDDPDALPPGIDGVVVGEFVKQGGVDEREVVRLVATTSPLYPMLRIEDTWRTSNRALTGRTMMAHEILVMLKEHGTWDAAFGLLSPNAQGRDDGPSPKLVARFDPNGNSKSGGQFLRLSMREADGNAALSRFDLVLRELQGMAEAKSSPIEFAEPNYLIVGADTPNDPHLAKRQWNMRNLGPNQLPGAVKDADCRAYQAWIADYLSAAATHVVAVLDSGIDLDHKDLKPNIWKNSVDSTFNGVDEDDKGAYPDDVNGFNFLERKKPPQDTQNHGTHCAGIIGAKGKDKFGVAGICWNVKLAALRILDDKLYGTVDDAAEAIRFAGMKQFRVLNCSWSTVTSGQKEVDTLKTAIQDAIKLSKELVIVAAAGNSDKPRKPGIDLDKEGNEVYPASFSKDKDVGDHVIAVTASHAGDGFMKEANHGAMTVLLAAPGRDVFSTIRGNGFQSMSGTSAATAHVSGAVALFLASHDKATAAQVKEAVKKGVDTSKPFEDKCVSKGRLNVLKLVTSK
jgi:subtilisin family serine protease